MPPLGPVPLPPGLTPELASCRVTIAGAKEASKRAAALARRGWEDPKTPKGRDAWPEAKGRCDGSLLGRMVLCGSPRANAPPCHVPGCGCSAAITPALWSCSLASPETDSWNRSPFPFSLNWNSLHSFPAAGAGPASYLPAVPWCSAPGVPALRPPCCCSPLPFAAADAAPVPPRPPLGATGSVCSEGSQGGDVPPGLGRVPLAQVSCRSSETSPGSRASSRLDGGARCGTEHRAPPGHWASVPPRLERCCPGARGRGDGQEQREGGRRRRLSQVQPESPEVAGCCVVVVDGQGGDGDEELIAGLQLKESPLVERVEPVVRLGRPALGAHPLEQEDGLAVGGLPVDALHELGDGDAGAGPVAGVAEVDLGVDVVLARLVDPQPAIPVGDVLQVRVDGAVFPAGDGVAAGLGEVPEALGVPWGEGRVTEGSEMLRGAPVRVRRKGGGGSRSLPPSSRRWSRTGQEKHLPVCHHMHPPILVPLSFG